MKKFSKFVAEFFESTPFSVGRVSIDSECVRFNIPGGVLHYDLLSHIIAVSNRYSLDMTIFSLDDGTLVLKFF